MGNKCHIIWCGESNIVYRWELFEEGYQPQELVNPYYQTVPGKSTTSLMLRMTKPFQWTEKIVITDIGFCLLRWLIDILIGTYMTVHWLLSLNIGQQKIMEIVSITIYATKREYDCLSVNWKDVYFDVLVLK